MISIPLPAATPRRKAAKRASAICASNIVIALVKHRSCDLGFEVFRTAIFMRHQDLAEVNLVIWNAAIYSTLVVQDVVVVG
jgi:hypothetical protein